jgi:hypothetical protein
MARTIKKTKPDYDLLACCFQNGGALNAYQVGILRALNEAGYYPDWFAGTSIGAIKKSPWLAPASQTAGITLYDMSSEQHLMETNQ